MFYYNNFIKKRLYIAILLLPFLEFFNQNVIEFTKEIFIYFVIYSVLILCLVFLVLALCEFFLNRQKLDFKIIFSIIFYFFFKHNLFQNILSEINIKFDGELSFLILILISVIIIFSFKKIVVKNFFHIFFFSYFIITFSQSLYGVILKYSYPTIILSKYENLFNELQAQKTEKKRNIYYVVVDGMTTLSNYEEKYEVKIDHFKEFINKYDLRYYDSVSAYTSTLTSFTSVLNLNYSYNDKSVTPLDRSKMFPETMKPHLVRNYPLIKTLNSLNYKFFWEGAPHPGTCMQYNLNFCIEKEKNNFKIFINRLKVHRYILRTFLINTPVEAIIFRLKLNYNYKINYPEFEGNNSIDKFIKKSKKLNLNSGPYFFLVHHMSPHDPYLYNPNCTYRQPTKTKEVYPKGYSDAFQCVLKKIENLITYINQNDSDSVIIIQGDHGGGFGNNDREIVIDNTKAFLLLKINNTKCNNIDLENKLDMINNVRLALSCATDQEVKLLKKKTFILINGKFSEL